MKIKKLLTTLLYKLLDLCKALTLHSLLLRITRMLRALYSKLVAEILKGCLFIAEALYRCGFVITMTYKRWRAQPLPKHSFKVIGVGNLAVGGTGKSVVVPFLIKLLGAQHCAVVLRGYGGSLADDGKAHMVTDGVTVFCSVEQSGDEAMMHATTLHVPVVVAHNRAKACALLEKFNQCNAIKYVILDDAYQHVSVHKDVEILLLDARYPIENSHCLPRGRLREKDSSRADIIIMTHADKVAADLGKPIEAPSFNNTLVRALAGLKSKPTPIFYSRHKPVGVFLRNTQRVVHVSAPLLLIAGVGSFAGVQQTAQALHLAIIAVKKLSNHFVYTQNNLASIIVEAQNAGCGGIVTTHKDWVKIEPLYQSDLPIYVVRIELELISYARMGG
jgi:tetraacyldisaccharide 4'-kinase